MEDIIAKFGQYVDKQLLMKPETARKELILGYKAFNLKLKYAPDKKLSPARQYLAKVCMENHISSFQDAENSAIISVFLPCEILQSFGIKALFAEGFSGYITGAYAEKALIEAAEAAGIAETYCSYHKIIMGAAMTGILPRPRFIVNTSVACDANNLTFRALAQYYNIPQFYIDIPSDQNEESIHYVAEQLRDLVEFIEGQTGTQLDENVLQSAVARSRDSLNNFEEAFRLKKNTFLSNDITSEMYEVFLTHPLLGTKQTLKYSQMLAQDLRNAESRKGLRLLWMHTIPYFQESLKGRLNFNDRCQIIACDMNFEGLVKMDPEKPYESMARRVVMSRFNGSSENRIQKAVEMAKQMDVDGVIYFCHWGCKQTMGAAVNAKKRLEEEGFPTLVLNGDGCDRSNTSDGQILTRLDAFIEMLEDMKK